MMAADVSAVSMSINKPAPGWFLARDTLLEGTSEIVCLSERDCARAQEWQHVETSDRWRGGLAHGLPSGDGVYIFANSRLQVRGSVHGDAEHLVFSGHGVMIWPDGARYDGELRESKFDGRGIFSWANGDCYEGAWREGQRHGTGTLVSLQTSLLGVFAVEIGKYANEMRYCGEWENDLMHGKGVIEYFEAPEGVCQDGDQAPPHGELLRRFEGLFKKGFPTSGSLQTRTEYFEQVHFDGATHAGDFATWYWTGSATGEERGTSLVDLACVGEEYRAASSRFSKSLPGLHIASIQRVQNDDRRVIYDLQRRALEKKVTAPPRSRVWNIRTMERWAFHAPVLPFLPPSPSNMAFPLFLFAMVQWPLWHVVIMLHIPKMQGHGAAQNVATHRHAAPWESIVEEGFQATLAGSDNGKVFGAGVYFATDAALAHKYALKSAYRGRSSLSAGSGTGREQPLRVFLSRIVTGIYTGMRLTDARTATRTCTRSCTCTPADICALTQTHSRARAHGILSPFPCLLLSTHEDAT